MILRITFRENDPTESRDGRAQRSIRMRVKPSPNVLPESFLFVYFPPILPIRFFVLRRWIRHFDENGKSIDHRNAIHASPDSTKFRSCLHERFASQAAVHRMLPAINNAYLVKKIFKYLEGRQKFRCILISR